MSKIAVILISTLVAVGGVLGSGSEGVLRSSDSTDRLSQLLSRYRALVARYPDAAYLDGAPEKVSARTKREMGPQLADLATEIREILVEDDRSLSSRGVAAVVAGSREHRDVQLMISLVRSNMALRMESIEPGGKSPELVREVALLLEIGNALMDDPSLGGQFLKQSIVVATSRLIMDDIAQYGVLHSTDFAKLAESLSSAAGDDNFAIRETLENERVRTMESLDSALNGLEAGDSYLADLIAAQSNQNRMDLATELAGLDSDQLAASVVGYDLAMRDLASAVDGTDIEIAAYEFNKVLSAIEAGIYGPIAMGAVLRTDLVGLVSQNLAEIATAQGKLERASKSVDAAKEFENAAVWYRIAYGEINQLDPNVRAAFGVRMPDNGQEISDADRERISRAFDCLRKAATIDRCEFQKLSVRESIGMWPGVEHVHAMRSLSDVTFGMLKEEVLDHLEVSRADLYKYLIMMARHLAQDGLVPSCELSSAILEKAFQLYVGDGRLDREVRADIHDLLLATLGGSPSDGVLHHDPFGFSDAAKIYWRAMVLNMSRQLASGADRLDVLIERIGAAPMELGRAYQIDVSKLRDIEIEHFRRAADELMRWDEMYFAEVDVQNKMSNWRAYLDVAGRVPDESAARSSEKTQLIIEHLLGPLRATEYLHRSSTSLVKRMREEIRTAPRHDHP